MKKVQMFMLLLLVAMIALQGAAYAKIIGGSVLSVDAEAKKIEIRSSADAVTASTWVGYNINTKWLGVTDPKELEGKTVEIEAIEDAATKNWIASSVEVATEKQATAAETAPATTPGTDKAAY